MDNHRDKCKHNNTLYSLHTTNNKYELCWKNGIIYHIQLNNRIHIIPITNVEPRRRKTIHCIHNINTLNNIHLCNNNVLATRNTSKHLLTNHNIPNNTNTDKNNNKTKTNNPKNHTKPETDSTILTNNI